MKTLMSSPEHVLSLARDIHGTVRSMTVIEDGQRYDFSEIRLSHVQNAIAQSLGYRHLHELMKAVSPDGFPSWKDIPEPSIQSFKTDFSKRLSHLTFAGDDSLEHSFHFMVASILNEHRVQDSISISMSDSLAIDNPFGQILFHNVPDSKRKIIFSGFAAEKMKKIVWLIIEIEFEMTKRKYERLLKEVDDLRDRDANTYIRLFEPSKPVLLVDLMKWFASLGCELSYSEECAADVLKKINDKLGYISSVLH